MRISFHQKAYACVHVLRHERPVLLVNRSHGSWCPLCGADDHTEDDYAVVGIGHFIEKDKRLEEILDLEPEWEAERASEDAPWVRALAPS